MSSRDIARLGLLTGLALGLYVVESALPRPLPWLRLGLSNAFILAILLTYGLRLALSISIIRTLVGSLVIGSFLGPGFFISISASITSCLAMGAAWYTGRRVMGPVGISIIGALAHNLTQLCVTYLLFIRRAEVFFLVPIFLFLSGGTGLVTGLAAHMIHERMTRSIRLI